MVFKANITNMTGYASGSPDFLRPEDTGIINQLTNASYRPANVQKLKKYGSIKTGTVTKISKKIDKNIKKKERK